MYRSLQLTFLPIALLVISIFVSEQSNALEPLTIKQDEHSVSIYQKDRLVTTYQLRSGSKPIFWPILDQDKNQFTRAYPMVLDSKDEKHDHPHHRGLWMSFGDVNGHDLWAEGKGKGTICSTGKVTAEVNGSSVHIAAKQVWRGGSKNIDSVSPDLSHGCNLESEKLADCDTTYLVTVEDSELIIDCIYQLTASQDLHFGDTKEGMFAIRVPEPMKVDNGKGRILTSEGRKDADSWGFPAQWVDYSGPTKVDSDEVHGIAILVHPKSFQAAGRWHVRSYGLFAHNPFGAADFPVIADKDRSAKTEMQNPPLAGGYLLKEDQTIQFAYRVIFHKGSYDLEQGNERFESYVQSAQFVN